MSGGKRKSPEPSTVTAADLLQSDPFHIVETADIEDLDGLIVFAALLNEKIVSIKDKNKEAELTKDKCCICLKEVKTHGVLLCKCEKTLICLDCFHRLSCNLPATPDDSLEDEEEDEEEDETNVFDGVDTDFQGRCELCEKLLCSCCKIKCDGECDRSVCDGCMQTTKCGSGIRFCRIECTASGSCMDCDQCEFPKYYNL